MQFSVSSLDALVSTWASDPRAMARAEAHNLIFDEHAATARIQQFTAFSGAPRNIAELRKELIEFYQLHVRTNSGLPQPFTPMNATATAGDLSGEQTLLRLEDLRDVMLKLGVSYPTLEAALHDTSDFGFIDDFLANWNIRPDIRKNPCAFATFKDEVLEDLDRPDWPDALRDRLGLAHYDPVLGDIPVALMEYTVDEVTQATTDRGPVAQYFSIPSVFDCAPDARFFPTGAQFDFGCPMALNVITSDEELVAEVIHPRAVYRRRNFKKIGLIKSRLPGTEIAELRNAHLWALRIASARDDFGLEL